MKRSTKIFYGVLFSFLFCFITIGYAALTDELNLEGLIGGNAQNEVFITDVIEPTSNIIVDGFYSTMLDQEITYVADSPAPNVISWSNIVL